MNPGPSTCQAPVPEGAPCYQGQLCEGGGACWLTAPDATTRACGKFAVLTTEGAACDTRALAVSSRMCDATEGFACVNGACQRALNGTLNAPCLAGDFTEELGCAPGLYCDTSPTSPTCQPLKPAGVSCGNSGGWSCQGFCVQTPGAIVPGSIIPDYLCKDTPCASGTWN